MVNKEPKPRDPRGLPAKESCRGPRRQLSYRVGSLAHITRSAQLAINIPFLFRTIADLSDSSSLRELYKRLQWRPSEPNPSQPAWSLRLSSPTEWPPPMHRPPAPPPRPAPSPRRSPSSCSPPRSSPSSVPSATERTRFQPGVSCIDAFRGFAGEGFGSSLGFFS